MAVHSKYERQLNFRQIGFSIKIPDAGKSLKPFDYVVGIPKNGKLRFVAIEAKKASGWTLLLSDIAPHQERALDELDRLSPYTSWLSIGFLDLPNMQLTHSRQPIESKIKKQSFLIAWIDAKRIAGDKSICYDDIIGINNSAMIWDKTKTGRYYWRVPAEHYFFQRI